MPKEFWFAMVDYMFCFISIGIAVKQRNTFLSLINWACCGFIFPWAIYFTVLFIKVILNV
jgi:hypothetical protein